MYYAIWHAEETSERQNRSNVASGLLHVFLACPDNDDDAVCPLFSRREWKVQRYLTLQWKRSQLHSMWSPLKTNFYTGLQAYALFMWLFYSVSDHVYGGTLLPLQDELFITLVKLRLYLALEDLAHRAGVSYTTATRTFFKKWLDTLHVRLSFLIKWHSRKPNKYLQEIFSQSILFCYVVVRI